MEKQKLVQLQAEEQIKYDAGVPDKKPEIPPAGFMTTIAWYSFKGGVGRSMSLANVCSMLAQSGYRIGVMDLDLEAPGLQAVTPFRVEADTRKGILGFLTDILNKNCDIDDIGDYIRPIKTDGPGEIFFFRAGPRDTSDYVSRLAAIKESGIFGPKSADGLYYLDQIKQWFWEKLNVHFLLVDARTGYSEMGGASTILLGDIVVLVTGLNENNLDSLNNPLQLIDKLRSEKDFRKRIIPLITIASPGETQWSFETRHQAAKTLAGCSEPIEVPPWTGAAFRAGSIVLEPWAPETLTTAYSKLTSRIIELSKKLADEVSPGERTPSDAERRLYAAKMFLKENPEDPLAHSGYGELLLKSGRKEEGFKELRKAVKLAPENRFILERLAKHLVIDKKFKESAVLYKKLLNMTKDEAPNHANLLIAQKAVFYTAMAAQEAKDQKAYRTIKKQCEDTFSRFFPDVKWKEDLSVGEQEPYIVVQRTYARCLDLLGETEKAEEVYTALIKMFPYDWDVFQDYLTFLSRNEKYEQYERTAREAIDRGFRIFDVLALYIPFLRNRNKAKQALQYLESLRVDPGNNAVMSYLFGTLYDKLGLYEQAISFYSQSIRINPYLRDAFADLANLLLLTDRNEEAVEVATQLIDRFDNDYFGHLIRAEALTELKHYRDAIPDIKTVIGSVTGNIAFLIWAAFASEESGEIELAEKCYRLMLEIPDSDGQLRAEALAKYALLVAKHFPDRPDEAEKMIAEALKLAPALEVVAAAVSLVGLYRVKNMSQEELPSFRLIEMANFTKKTGEAQSVESDLWETLQRIKDCEGCDLETRMTAGITLAKSIIKSGDFSRGRELIAELRTKKIPGGFDSAMIDLQLSIYGMDKTKKSEETSMQDINKETKDITSGTQEPGDSD